MSRKFSRKELENCNGKNGKPAYIVYNGDVYDVSDSAFWEIGNHFDEHYAGLDLTEALENAPHGSDVFEGIVKVGIVED